jgi:hypothetical protein
MNYQERYRPIIVGVNGTVRINGSTTGGFLVATAGTITINNDAGVPIMTPTTVTAGIWIPLPFYIQNPQGGIGGTLVCSGGASGTLGV